MKVSILVFRECMSLPSIGSMEMLRKAGRLHAEATGGSPDSIPFDVRLVSCDGTAEVHTSYGLVVPCHETVADPQPTDLALVPAFDGDVLEQMGLNRGCIPWLRRQFEWGADLASMCTGAFALAEAGLLDGRAATTHWAAEALFRQRYPRVELRPQQIIVDEGRVCTSGGATSFLNMVIYLVEKYLGPETANVAARMFLIDVNKAPQGVYAIFSGQKSHGDPVVLAAQDLIEQDFHDGLSVDGLARRVATSRRNFIRRFKRATGNTPIEYIQRVRVEAAKQSLAATRTPLAEVAWKVGYQDLAAFRRIFTRITGVSPSAYRSRYNLN